jgi:hypothetical protein
MWYAVIFLYIQGLSDVVVTEADYYTFDQCHEHISREIYDYETFFNSYSVKESVAFGVCFQKPNEGKI